MPCPTHYDAIRERWLALAARVAQAARDAGRDPAGVGVLAVTKTFGADDVRAAYALGQRAFGENYVQEAIAKMDATADLPGVDWHLIGPLQSNKAKLAATRFAWVQTIDREKIARRLAEARPPQLPPLNVCVQVNISAETTKSGVAPADAVALALEISKLPRLALRGFMGIAEPTDDVARQRDEFRALARCLDEARRAGLAPDTLSMGMSHDLEAAIAEGATLIRIGSALFGART